MKGGFSLVEMLITMAIMAIIGGALVGYVSASVKAHRLQSELRNLEQNTAVVEQLLQSELRTAAYRGGDPKDYKGGTNGSYWTTTNKIKALTYLQTNWNSLLDSATGWDRDTITTTAGSSSNPDTLSIRRLASLSVGSSASTSVQYTIDKLTYTLSSSKLTRQAGSVVFNAADTTASTFSAPGTSSSSSGTAQAVASNLEDFQVFFQTSSGWQSGLPTSATTASGSSTVNTVKALGLYVRLRSAQPFGSNSDCTWPKSSTFTNLQSGLSTTTVGVPSTTYTGTNCRYLRNERIVVVGLTNLQSW